MRSVFYLFFAPALLAPMVIGQAKAATILFHADQASFMAAMESSAFEDFGDRNLIAGLSLSSNVRYGNSVMTHEARPGSDAVLSFAGGITGFSGRYSLGPTVEGGGLRIDVTFADGTIQRLDDIIRGSGTYAFTSDTAITSIRFGSRLGRTENWDLLDLTAGTAKVVAPVPEPASWAMMIGGLGLAGGALRGRRRKVAQFV